MMKRFTLTVASLLMGMTTVMAQNTKVTGQVLDENGEPVIGASVVVKGTTIGTVTDFDGNFTLDVPSNGKQLEISYVGMKTKQVGVASNINAVLESDSQALDEVVVTGYGVQKKASFTGAASIIGEDVLSKKTDANFVKALEGSVPAWRLGIYLCSRSWIFKFRNTTSLCNRWNAY